MAPTPRKARKKRTTIALGPDMDLFLSRAAKLRGVSRAELIRQQLALVLEQYRPHPRPRRAAKFVTSARSGIP